MDLLNLPKPLKFVRDLHGTPRTGPEILAMKIDRWVMSRKALVLDGLKAELYTKEQACEAFRLEPEELEGWITYYDKGKKALRLVRGRNER